jgi:hypothetical protein
MLVFDEQTPIAIKERTDSKTDSLTLRLQVGFVKQCISATKNIFFLDLFDESGLKDRNGLIHPK